MLENMMEDVIMVVGKGEGEGGGNGEGTVVV